jgi:hypothetical protein
MTSKIEKANKKSVTPTAKIFPHSISPDMEREIEAKNYLKAL